MPGKGEAARAPRAFDLVDNSWEDQDEQDEDELETLTSTSPGRVRTPKRNVYNTSTSVPKAAPGSGRGSGQSGRSSPVSQASTILPSASAAKRTSMASQRRKTVPRRRAVIPLSPPRTARPQTPSAPPSTSRSEQQWPSLTSTLSFFLMPLRLLLAPVQTLLSPFFFHLANGLLILLLLALATYFLLPLIPSLLLTLTGKLLRLLARNMLNFDFSANDISLGADTLLFPLRTVATPACALTGLMCPLSLLSTVTVSVDNSSGNVTETKFTAKPFWRWGGGEKNQVDVGQVARALAKEARGARDIFDSVRMLGQGSLVGGLEYVRVWELGVAVLTGSSLDDRAIVGQKLIELGDLTRDLSDEIININSQSVNAFSWLQWEFARLVQLLSLPPDERPDPAALSRKLHSLLVRLSSTLDTLHHLTSQSVQHASQASSHGSTLLEHLHSIRYSLEAERDRSPIWKRVYDKSSHLVVGGEPTRSELIDRDLSLARETIGNLGDLRWKLEDTRMKVKVFRDQIGMFDASIMGFHLGAGEGELGPEEEVRVLAGVVEELGQAVKGAKEGRGERSDRVRLAIDS